VKTDPHVVMRGTFEVSGLSDSNGLPMQRTLVVHDGTCILTSWPDGRLEIRIAALRCPGPGVCMSIVDHVPVWVRVLRWLRWR